MKGRGGAGGGQRKTEEGSEGAESTTVGAKDAPDQSKKSPNFKGLKPGTVQRGKEGARGDAREEETGKECLLVEVYK